MFEVFKYGFFHWWDDFNNGMIMGGWVIGMFLLPIIFVLFVVYVACIVFGINILINKKIREKRLFNTKAKRIFLSALLICSPIFVWVGLGISHGLDYCKDH